MLTLKCYRREELLPQGRVITRTSAEYDEGHVERVRLVRALTAVGGLDPATTRRVITVEHVTVSGTATRPAPR
ncbi:MerR family transcriptional regulator [Janibacter cremeus]|uniref:MerR family transcriptional regulator n=1 Tax=Janibacter cremeus TaxID=1285192 RepID=UPI0023F9B798|nr:MerR family transcriptional regulator [Janibacter cremeus]WEV77450.1 MerR family transcriptional regulator [Janibacter cremeus]